MTVKMLNNASIDKRKRRQYPIRLSDEQYARLKAMAVDGKMSDVVNRGIETEWIYYQAIKKMAKELPDFDESTDIEQWRVEQFKNSPELLARYATPLAIFEHKKELQRLRETKRMMVNNQETIAYLIRQIGNNINQLAKHANRGGTVAHDDLTKVTKAVLKLNNTIEKTWKEV